MVEIWGVEIHWTSSAIRKKLYEGCETESEPENWFVAKYIGYFGFQSISEAKKDQNWENPRKIFQIQKPFLLSEQLSKFERHCLKNEFRRA